MTKWVLWVFYGIVLFVGAAVIDHRYEVPPPSLVATRNLPPNWLLQSQDIVPADSRLRYTNKAISAGQPITVTDTSELPKLTSKPGYFLAAIPVDAKFVVSGQINAGRYARICSATETLTDDAVVQAVICLPEEAQCVSVNQLSTSTAAAISTKLGEKSIPTLQPKDSSTCKQ
jgi:hypothetical protein